MVDILFLQCKSSSQLHVQYVVTKALLKLLHLETACRTLTYRVAQKKSGPPYLIANIMKIS